MAAQAWHTALAAVKVQPLHAAKARCTAVLRLSVECKMSICILLPQAMLLSVLSQGVKRIDVVASCHSPLRAT
jgi:hypothetical protein